MAEDEGRDEGEDLFEDLDKFFAPIQDVDWPEPTGRPGPEPEPQGHERDRSGQVPRQEGADRGSTPPVEPPTEVPVQESAEHEAEGATPGTSAAGEPPSEEAPGPGTPEESAGARPDEREQDQGDEVPDDGVGSYLFEAEAEDYERGEDGGEEEGPAEAGAPSGYVDVPGPQEEAEVAELVEETREEPPDIEAVEAAADHFAESVRDEVRIEPEPESVGRPTEEVAMVELLEEDDAQGHEEAEGPRTVRVGAEGFGGPSWQEPTAIEVGTEAEGRGPGRNVPTAFLTGLVLAGLAVGAILLGPGPFAIFAGIVVLFAQGEFYLAMQKRHYQPATGLGLVSGALILGAGYYRGENAMLAIMALSLFATFLWYMTVPPQHRRNIVSNIAITMLGIAYIPLLAAYALAVLKLPDGEGLTLSIIGLTFVYDTAAFGVGYFWGSRPLAPNVSPKKSWEGAIGATLVVIAVAVGVVAPAVTLLDTVGRSVGLAVVVALFAPLGDLAESLIKRDLGIKDMGGILPGHGGVMDRIDSVLFVAPAAFIYLRLILL